MSYNFDTHEEAIATITEETESLTNYNATHTAVVLSRTVKELKEAVADYDCFDVAESIANLNDNASAFELINAKTAYLTELEKFIHDIERDICEIATIIVEKGWFIKKKYTEEEEEMFKILNENKELGRKVALKIVDMIDEEMKQKKLKLIIVGVYDPYTCN